LRIIKKALPSTFAITSSNTDTWDVDIIKVDANETGCDGVDWIQLLQNREWGGCYEDDNEPLGLHKRREISWVAKRLLASQEGCSISAVSNSILFRVR
jgi:hypothetical protein